MLSRQSCRAYRYAVRRLPAASRSLSITRVRSLNASSTNETTSFSNSLQDPSKKEKIQAVLAGYQSNYFVDNSSLPFVDLEKGSEVQTKLLGQTVRLNGFIVNKKSLSNGMHFAALGCGQGRIQLLAVKQSEEANLDLQAFKNVRANSAVTIEGKLRPKVLSPREIEAGKKVDTSAETMPLDTLEVEVLGMQVLNEFPKEIINNKKSKYGPERRHLQLRFEQNARKNLVWKSEALTSIMATMSEAGFTHVDTPILFKSTPEGAREFLVPTRKKGHAYALSQSPQQYKQILMSGGVSRYYQVARCFRDEDLRADRQPEFTQIDLEMAWVDRKGVMGVIERVMKQLYKKLDVVCHPTEIMRYPDAMALYGSDKPDLRVSGKIHNITAAIPQSTPFFTSLDDPVIEFADLKLGVNGAQVLEVINDMIHSASGLQSSSHDNPDGSPAYLYNNGKEWVLRTYKDLSTISETSEASIITELTQAITQQAGSESLAADTLYIIQARKNEPLRGGSTSLGRIRPAAWRQLVKQNLIPENEWRVFRPLWMIDFPLFTPNDDAGALNSGTAGFSSTHHPFTAPQAKHVTSFEEMAKMLADPLSITGEHYDYVLNGVEIGGGSVRIHDAAMQELVLREILQIPETTLQTFGHLLDALRAGCPPHAGFAFGFDRLVATLMFEDSITKFLAFPKDNKGRDPLVKSPSKITPQQAKTYGFQVGSSS